MGPGRPRARQQWLQLGAVLIAVGLFAIWARYSDYREVDDEQRHLLVVQARGVDEALSRQLAGVGAALRDLRDDLARRPAGEVEAGVSSRLQALGNAMPGVGSLVLLDRSGRAVAANRSDLLGRDLSDRDYFQLARDQSDPKRLSLSPPFMGSLGTYSMNLSLPVRSADGAFAGVVTSMLDPDYFRSAIRPTLYAVDSRGAVIHADGRLLMFEPRSDKAVGMNVDTPGSFFRRHVASGQLESLLTGVCPVTGDKRMMALRTVRPSDLYVDKPIVIAIGRNLDAMFATWWRQTLVYGLLYSVFAAVTSSALVLVQRRQRAIDFLNAQRKESEHQSARRLELALEGADLGLWDFDVPSGATLVSERINSMLGLPHQNYPDSQAWRSRVHPDDLERVREAKLEHLEGRAEHFDQTYRMLHADGHWVWVLDRSRVFERDAQGKPLRMVGTHMDVTEQVEARLALQRSEQSLSTTLYSIGDAVVATDAQGRIVRMNATAERLSGWPAPEAIGQQLTAVFRIVNARTGELSIDPARQVIERGEVVGLTNDTVLLARDGREYNISDSAAPIRTPEGTITGVVLVFSDISERYRAQQVLRANEERLRTLLDNLRSGVVIHAADTRIVDANASACRMLGLTIEQLRGRDAADPHWTFLEEDGQPMTIDRYPVNQVRASGEPLKNFMVGFLRSDLESPLWALCNAFVLRNALGDIENIVVTISDITERMEAELLLRESEALRRSVLDSLNAHIAVVDRDGVIIAVNEAWRRYGQDHGVSARFIEPIGVSYLNLCADSGAAAPASASASEAVAALDGIRSVLAGFEEEFHLEYPCNSATETLWFRMSVTPMHGSRGGAVIAHMPVTELKQAEQNISAARAELQATLEAVPDLLFEIDREGRFHNFHSPRHERLHVSPDAFIGRVASDVLPTEVVDVIRRAIAQAEAAGYSSGYVYELALPGGPHWFELSVARKPMPDGEVPRFIALARDISERKLSELEREALESQLREAQKMESIGTLAGGIAHDFNNILAAILGNVALAREDVAAGHSVLASLEQINRAGLRARHLVKQILAFSRREQHEFSLQPLGPVIAETIDMLRATLPAGVRLDTVVPELPVEVRGDSTQLQQVLLNLCTNAWQALPEQGGRIEIGFERMMLDEAQRQRQRVTDLPPGTCVHLWVRDNGCGMDEATRLRIFDPFFTTKKVGRGTGLGLSVVHGIVRAHQGAIGLDTVPGQGTTFHVYLPNPERRAAERPVEPDSIAGARGSGQHVLYIDDDEVMVLMVERLLKRAGFRVTVETRAAAALELVRAQPQDFDAVVSDFNMPELSGIDVASQIACIRPDLPVVISSGLLTDELRSQAEQLGVRALMHKENTFEELASLLQRLLAPAAS